MKRLLLGSSVFFVAFCAGYILVPDFRTILSDHQAPKAVVEVIQQDANTELIVPSTEIKHFVPEFRELPNFEDVYREESNYSDSGEKLIQILDDGIYRRSEVAAKSDEKWLVFFDQGGKHNLRESTASVKKLNSVSWPGDEKDARLAFSGAGKPVIAVRNIQGLRPGKINTLFHISLRPDLWGDGNSEMDSYFIREFRLNGTWYILRVSKGLTRDNTKVAVLVLESNRKSQVIKQVYHVPSEDKDIVGSLLWAGDMDGDGKLDLYFDEFNEKGFSRFELHLSTSAIEGDLVGLAASFGMAGC